MTRLAIFGDVHGNLPALEACLKDVREHGADALICLGDVASDGAWPRECVGRVRELGCEVVMGNADEELLNPPKAFAGTGPFPDAELIHDLGEWAKGQLSEAERVIVRTYQKIISLDVDGISVLAFHGSPASNREELTAQTPDERLSELRELYGTQAFWVGGHTHRPLYRTLEGWALLNPGSVGLAFKQRGERYVNVARAEYLLLDVTDGKVSVTFRRVPYDVEAVREGILTRKLPHAYWWANEWVDDGSASL